MGEVQDSGRTTEEVAITTITAAITTAATEAEAPTGVDITHQQTEVLTTTATQRPATTPQAIAIRAMDQEVAEDKLGEGEVLYELMLTLQ